VTAADYTLEIPNFDGRLFWFEICQEKHLSTDKISAEEMRNKLVELIEMSQERPTYVAEINFSFNNGSVI
jgi:hypothetical protein